MVTILDDLTDELIKDAHGEQNLDVLDGLVTTDGQVKGFHVPEDEKWRLVPEFARDRDYPFFLSTVDYAIEKVVQYAKIRKENETDKDKKAAWDKVAFDLDKSDLLQRLLRGETPLELPPPKTFKSNWYEIVETGRGIPTKVKFGKYTSSGGGFDDWKDGDEYAIIDEFAWKIVTVHENGSFTVKYHDSYKAPKFLLRKATEDEVKSALSPREYRATGDISTWILEQEES